MDYIRFAITNPVKVTVGVLLLLLFGFIALFAIPIQLVPNVDQPVITVQTSWVGKDPEQIERDIIEEQEDKLKRVGNLKKMIAVASQGQAEITLEFYIGTNMTRAVQEVSDKLREVPSYPENVDEPVITVADAASQNAIAWMVITSSDPNFDIESIREPIEDRVKPYLERIGGVSQVNVYGGRDREVHIQIDPSKMAQRGITFNQLRAALQSENVNVSAGDISEGRLDVRVRTVGQYDNLEDIRRTIVANTPAGPIRVRDLGDVVMTLQKRRAFVRSRGEPAIALNAIRETGSNVIEVMEQLRSRLDDLNKPGGVMAGLGPGLVIQQVYDETDYIYSAIDLVLSNLWIGGSLAVLVLLVFLRVIRPTLIIAMSIPTSVIGTFVVMTAFGRNLNVVSLAGLAFAVGMVVDNAIVVLENIERHLSMGKKPVDAAYDATREVWGAVLASTLTTLAVFIPVLFMQEEAGQLFRDISLAVCAAVTLSLIIGVTVIPSASAHWLRPRTEVKSPLIRWLRDLFGLATLLDHATRLYSRFIHWLAKPSLGMWSTRVAIVAFFTLVSIGGAYLIMPPTSYLPNGNRNLIFGMMLTPPAYSIEHNQSIAYQVEAKLRPYWEAKSATEIANFPPVIHPYLGQPITGIAPVENYFFVTFTGTIFMGASSTDASAVKPLEGLLNAAMSETPGAIAFAFQPSIFGRTLGGANAVEVELAGPDLASVRRSAAALFGAMVGQFGMVRPDPMNFNLSGPEVRVQIDRVRAADLGINVASLGLGVQSLVDGSIVGDFRTEGKSVDLLLVRHPDFALTPQVLEMVPIAVPQGDGTMGTVSLGSVAKLVEGEAPQQIKRIEELRAVTLTINPPPELPLEQATSMIQQTITQMRESGEIEPGVEATLAGTADKLIQVRQALLGKWEGFNFQSVKNLITSRMFLALLVTYLLMCALFESFTYPFVIMFTVPLATIGGFIGIRVVHTFVPEQQLDVLAMLGFVILIGVVVNNAILIVHQSLNFMRGLGESEQDKRDPLMPREAIAESVRTRIRPIMMTTMTSLFGMLPLVLMPGSGSELYRGLGAVVLGGLLVSTIFTLLVVPTLFSIVIDIRVWLTGKADTLSPLFKADGVVIAAGATNGDGQATKSVPVVVRKPAAVDSQTKVTRNDL